MFRPGISMPDTGAGLEQPRPVEDVRAPSAAERVRTLVESSVSAALVIPGTEEGPENGLPGAGAPEARAVTADGDLVFLLPAASVAGQVAARAQDDEVTAVMELTDVAPVAVPHRIRGRAWVAGWLTAVQDEEHAACAALLSDRHPEGPLPGAAGDAGAEWVLVRLEFGEAYVDDLWGAEHVEPDEFGAAETDPLVPYEAELLQHLDSSHADQMLTLGTLLGEREPECGPGMRAAPLALDRYGMRVRFCEQDGKPCFDARFEFPGPVDGMDRLRRTMRSLFEAAADEDLERRTRQWAAEEAAAEADGSGCRGDCGDTEDPC